MTILGYVQHLSQTHLSGHLKSRPSTPAQSAPVTPTEPTPAPLPPVIEPASEPPAAAVADPVESPAAPAEPVSEPTVAHSPPAVVDVATDNTTSDGLPVVDVAAILAESETPNHDDTAATEQQAAPAVAPIEGIPAPVVVAEEVTVEAGKPDEPVVVTDTIAAVAVVEPTDKQPTATHAEQGNLHTPAEAATTVDGTPAEVPAAETTEAAEVKEETKEKKPKAERAKSEGKGFFAKLFSKSPKKDKKVKEEKAAEVAATEETSAAEATETAVAPVETVTEPEVKPEITGAAIVSDSAAAASTEPVKEVEVPAAAAEEVKPVEAAPTEADKPKEEDIKAIKARRRISTRITSFVKDLGKKKETPKEEKTEEEATATAGAPVEAAKAEEGAEAPQLAAPIATEPIEPIVIDEKKPVAPATVPAVSTAA